MRAAFVPRTLATWRYLKAGSAPWQWRIRMGKCPNCSARAFVAFAPSPLHTRCLGCRASLVNLSLIPVVAMHVADDPASKIAYEMSSYGATLDYLRRNFKETYFSEYNVGRALGSVENGVRNEDATRLTFADETFDIVTSNQVFEHVTDDIKAYGECRRVLKRGGALVFTVPLHDSPRTEQVARMSAGGTMEWLGTPEFHDSRLTGPGSAPVFWRHSRADIATRLRSAGFSTPAIVPVKIVAGQGQAQPVIYAVK